MLNLAWELRDAPHPSVELTAEALQAAVEPARAVAKKRIQQQWEQRAKIRVAQPESEPDIGPGLQHDLGNIEHLIGFVTGMLIESLKDREIQNWFEAANWLAERVENARAGYETEARQITSRAEREEFRAKAGETEIAFAALADKLGIGQMYGKCRFLNGDHAVAAVG